MEWPKKLQVEGMDVIGKHIRDDEYWVYNGSWYFTAELIMGRYYLMSVDGYVTGANSDRFIGLELIVVEEG